MGVVCWWGPRWVESSTRPVPREGERKPRVGVDSDEHARPAPDDPLANVEIDTGGHPLSWWLWDIGNLKYVPWPLTRIFE